jgi:hypothetical protein
MSRVQLGLILAALGCAEPTATSPRPAAPAIAAEQHVNSYWINAADRTVYVKLAEVRGEGEPIHAFMRRMFASADSVGARRLVIDLRSIAGSDARVLVPLIKGVVTRDRFARPGGLALKVGANNFGPGQNAATLLQQYANPILLSDTPYLPHDLATETEGLNTDAPDGAGCFGLGDPEDPPKSGASVLLQSFS